MLRVEESLVSHFSCGVAEGSFPLTLKTMPDFSYYMAGYFPDRPCILRLVSKAYAALGMASGGLQIMAVLQFYQADVLKDLDQGEGLSLD